MVRHLSGNPTSMIGLCQEGKSSPDALRRSAGVNSFRFFAACVGLSAVVPILNRTRLPFAGAAFPAAQKIEFVFSCQSRNLSTGASGACAPSPSRFNGKTWQATRSKKSSLFAASVLRSDVATRLCYLKIPLPTVDGHEVGHQLSCHRQRCAIRIALLLFLVVEHGQLRAVARRHLRRLDQRGL